MQPATIREYDPHTLKPAPGNSEPTVEEVTKSGLMASMRDGQKVPGMVTSEKVIVMGHRRALCCKLLGIPFLAVEVPAGLPEAEIIGLRLTENCIRRTMSPFEIAADLAEYVRLTGGTQEEAAARFGFSPAKASKLLAIFRKAVPDVRAALEAGAVCVDVARIIAALPPEKQPELLARAVVVKKRDLVERMAKGMRGGKVKAPKQFKWNGGAGTVTVPGNWTPQQLRDWLAERLKAVDHAVKHSLPLEALAR